MPAVPKVLLGPWDCPKLLQWWDWVECSDGTAVIAAPQAPRSFSPFWEEWWWITQALGKVQEVHSPLCRPLQCYKSLNLGIGAHSDFCASRTLPKANKASQVRGKAHGCMWHGDHCSVIRIPITGSLPGEPI